MSDVMLLGVLRAPYPETPLELSQLVQRARQAADAIEARDAELAALRAECERLRSLLVPHLRHRAHCIYFRQTGTTCDCGALTRAIDVAMSEPPKNVSPRSAQ